MKFASVYRIVISLLCSSIWQRYHHLLQGSVKGTGVIKWRSKETTKSKHLQQFHEGYHIPVGKFSIVCSNLIQADLLNDEPVVLHYCKCLQSYREPSQTSIQH